jgi:2-polyprenyl-6-methoxyphenol hydroxylase-like FAD-dependent oxidoreductase
MQAIVVGGGIGGLSLALSLHQAGIGVRVYEAAREIAPLGVGINLQPTAVRELAELGLGDDLARIGIATQALCYFSKLGQLIHSEKRGLAAGYKWPQYSIHRGRLQELLVAAARARLGADAVRCGMRFDSFEQDGNLVRATFSDSETGKSERGEADVLVGADGIHSAVRHQLYPTEGSPRFARQFLWRAATEADPFLGGHTMAIVGHLHQRIVAYPIAPVGDGKRVLINWICQMTVPDEAPPREDWNRRVSQEKVMAAFGNWRTPWLDMAALIERTPDIYEFPLVDRDPLPAWTSGRVTLLGDAAHPMFPIGSQAGSQAIVDARVLTATLLAARDPAQALQHYEAERRPAMNEIVLRNRQFGPELVMQLVEERAPRGFARIDDVISRDELEEIIGSYATAAGLDAEAVNTRRAYVPAVA